MSGWRNKLKQIGRYIVFWFRRPEPRKTTLPGISVPGRAKDAEKSGKWYFKRDILDKLDRYRISIKRMKKLSPTLYSQYKRVGATLVPDNVVMGTTFNSQWGNILPAFGCVAFMWENDEPGDDIDARIPLRFGCFQKMKNSPPMVQASNGDIYECVIFLLTERKYKGQNTSAGIQFYISMTEGEPRLLKELRTFSRSVDRAKVNGVKRIRNGGLKCSVRSREWDYPHLIRCMYEEHKRADETIDQYAGILLGFIHNALISCSSDIRISALKNGIRSVFCVDLLRTPQFFSDRDWVANEKGSRQRIFHIVRTHRRVLGGGRETYVKSHFRGTRRFIWNGYKVTISMPGYHHSHFLDFEAAAFDEEDPEMPMEGTISAQEAAKLMAEHMDR